MEGFSLQTAEYLRFISWLLKKIKTEQQTLLLELGTVVGEKPDGERRQGGQKDQLPQDLKKSLIAPQRGPLVLDRDSLIHSSFPHHSFCLYGKVQPNRASGCTLLSLLVKMQA